MGYYRLYELTLSSPMCSTMHLLCTIGVKHIFSIAVDDFRLQTFIILQLGDPFHPSLQLDHPLQNICVRFRRPPHQRIEEYKNVMVKIKIHMLPAESRPDSRNRKVLLNYSSELSYDNRSYRT